jgi:hypothetical protein
MKNDETGSVLMEIDSICRYILYIYINKYIKNIIISNNAGRGRGRGKYIYI